MAAVPKKKYFACTVKEFEEEGRIIVQMNKLEVGIFKVSNHFYAWINICPHGAAPICEGSICGTRLPSLVYHYQYGKEQEVIRCPWHGWEFDLKTGKHLANQKAKLKEVEVKVEGEEIYLYS